MNAIIAGASGLIGRFLVNDLLSRDRYERVIALVRSDLGLSSPKLSIARVDFAALDSTAPGDACAGADLFCTLGTTIKKTGSQDAFRRVDHDAVLAFARWGLAHGARRFFVVTALGADAASSVFYSRVKGEVERDIASLGFAETHVFRPSLLLGPREEFRLAWMRSAASMQQRGAHAYLQRAFDVVPDAVADHQGIGGRHIEQTQRRREDTAEGCESWDGVGGASGEDSRARRFAAGSRCGAGDARYRFGGGGGSNFAGAAGDLGVSQLGDVVADGD